MSKFPSQWTFMVYGPIVSHEDSCHVWQYEELTFWWRYSVLVPFAILVILIRMKTEHWKSVLYCITEHVLSVAISWIVTLCSLVFRVKFTLQMEAMFLWNVGNHLQDHMMSQPETHHQHLHCHENLRPLNMSCFYKNTVWEKSMTSIGE
jgi:hypothetical protein